MIEVTAGSLGIITIILLLYIFIINGTMEKYKAESEAANETIRILSKQLAYLNYQNNKEAAEFIEYNY